MDVKPGYYTIEDMKRGGTTVCLVREGEREVEIMRYTPGYEREDVFGEKAQFRVISGPWEA